MASENRGIRKRRGRDKADGRKGLGDRSPTVISNGRRLWSPSWDGSIDPVQCWFSASRRLTVR